MEALLVIIPSLMIGLWLVAIRPYLLRHKQAFTRGAHWGFTTIWVDWGQAKDFAKKQGDTGMTVICRVFLVLQIAFGVAVIWWMMSES
jgi:hypothetical protein